MEKIGGFKLILVDLQEKLVQEWKKDFSGSENVDIIHGKFESIADYDCMVSAANSFGLMDGGVDQAISDAFGQELPKAVRQYIIDHFDGEQPVGTSFVIETGCAKHPFLAHTPTMRVPYSIQGTDYVYLAMKAMLSAIRLHNKNNEKQIRSVVCVGLGTFYGNMDLKEASRQMFLGYKNFLNPPIHIDWTFASKRQEEIIYGGYEGFRIFSSRKYQEKTSEELEQEEYLF